MSPGVALAKLGEADLRALAAEIRSRRLGPPFGMTAVQRITGAATAAAVAKALVCLSLEGSSMEGIASCLEIVAEAAASRPPLEQNVQLVMTGPEGQTYHRDTAVVVQDLFRRAERTVLVAGYAVYDGKQVFEELARRMDEVAGLHVRLFLNVPRKSEEAGTAADLVAAFVNRFKSFHWPAGSRLPELYFDRRTLHASADSPVALHAKCIAIDGQELFISSANFTEAAQHRNVEVGVLVRSPSLARQATAFFDALIQQGVCVRCL